MQLNIETLPYNAQLLLSELGSSPIKGKRGILPISESHIRRLEAQGLFPRHRKITGSKRRYYIAGEVKDWMDKLAASEAQ